MRQFFCWLMVVGVMTGLQQARAENITLVSEPVAIPVGQTHEFDFGTVPQAGTTVLLKIRSRINSKTLAGSWMVMKVELNGHEVQAQKSRTAMRLLNKPLESPVTPAKSGPWYLTKQGWRTLYAPDFESALSQSYYVDDPYTIVLDVTDLTNPVAENRLKITNTASADIKAHSSMDAALVIGLLEVETKPVPSPMMAVSTVPTVLNRGEPAAAASAYRGVLLPGGGFALEVGKNTYRFSSAFSYPNAGFNRLIAGAPETVEKSSWKVATDAKAERVVAESSDYRIVRTVKFGKTRVEIADAITNLHADTPLGVAVRHEMDLTGVEEPQVRLAGDSMQNDYYAPGNPSVHVVVPSGAVGIIAEDNVLRSQALLYTRDAQDEEPAVAGIRTDMFRLAPKATYTLRWAVYPVAGADYYDFANLVRHDWKANVTIPGGVWWISSPDGIIERPLSAIRDVLRLNGIRYVMITGSWVDHKRDSKILGFGTAVFEEPFTDYRRRIREAVQKLHEASPDVKVLGYYDVQRDSSENSSRRFADSPLTGADGKPISTDWGGKFDRSYNMVPTLENSFGKAALETANRYMSDLQLDGIYWDEMTGTGFNSPLLTYNMSDGHTAVLDPETWTIKQEAGLVTLLSLPFRLRVIQEVQERAGVLLGNGALVTQDVLHTGIMQMMEIQHNDEFARRGDLQTPFGFMAADASWEHFLRAFRLAKIPLGMIPGIKNSWVNRYSHDIMSYLFPFTPIELHAGYLLGEERIIATHSGNYGWHGKNALFLTHQFDSKGKLTDKKSPITISSKEARSAIDLDDQEAVVLEKLPLCFEPAKQERTPEGQATVTVQQYDAKTISLEIDASSGGVLTVQNGVFPLTDGQQVSIQLKTAGTTLPPRSMQPLKQTLSITIPAGFQGSCLISPSG